MNATLRAAVHLGKDYDMNLRYVKNDIWENNGTAFHGNGKADQWSDRNHWHKPDQFPRFEVSTRQAYCTVELINIPLPESMSSPILFSVWERWETILLNLGRAKFNGIRTTIISAN